MTPNLFSVTGKPLKLAHRIGKGGEGEVYALSDEPDIAIKMYTVPDVRSREAKIAKMIAEELAKRTPLIAFPIEPIRDKAGVFAGFTMRRVNEHQPLHELYSPAARKAAFPRADYRFLVRTATNISRAVAATHAAGCVIGDINHSGILISDRATTTLIDADSFQIVDGAMQYLCKVAVPEYTPPELQGAQLDQVLRTSNHDAFGLAVVIFQLLWMGRHPFSGRYARGEIQIEQAIAQHRFAYSRQRSTEMQPPPAVPGLADFPKPIGDAFETAFGPAGRQQRPTAAQWIALLSELETSLKKCGRNSLHYYPDAASECPWCKMERIQGMQLFVPAVNYAQAGAFAPVRGDIAAIWRAIEAVQAPSTNTQSPTFAPVASPSASAQAQAAIGAKQQRRALGVGLIAIAGVCLVALPAYFLIWLILGGVGVRLVQGKTEGDDELLRNAKDIELRFLEAERDWIKRNDASGWFELKENLRRLKSEFDGLPLTESRRIQEHERNRRAEQLKVFLEGFQIRREKIANVGPTKLATLTSYGIETAADVSSEAVQNVPGFGPVNSQPLLEWRRKLEARFVYNANPTIADKVAISTIRTELAQRADDIKKELTRDHEWLVRMAATFKQRQQSVDPFLQTLHEQREQVRADLKLLNLTLPPVQLPARPTAATGWSPAPSPAQSPRSSTAKPGGLQCPTCGSRMVARTAKRGRRAGSKFWGCSRYPNCRGTRPR
jgi:DNA-binding helix-hairpin-helix protein with protein kinase domain